MCQYGIIKIDIDIPYITRKKIITSDRCGETFKIKQGSNLSNLHVSSFMAIIQVGLNLTISSGFGAWLERVESPLEMIRAYVTRRGVSRRSDWWRRRLEFLNFFPACWRRRLLQIVEDFLRKFAWFQKIFK
jgi:hypothetical protein